MSDPGVLANAADKNSLIGDLVEHQTFLIIAMVVFLHVVLLSIAFMSLWKQAPTNKIVLRSPLSPKEE